jgi:parallel beta-helix repeat protein
MERLLGRMMKVEWKAAVWVVMLTLLGIGMLMVAFDSLCVEAEPRTILVPDEYATIQEAINAASLGDTVYVKAGTYYESVVVNTTVSLIGESKEATIIEAGWRNNAIHIVADNVCVRGFTIRGSGGILVDASFNSSISGNNIEGKVEVVDFHVFFSGDGIHLQYCSNCSVSENNISYTKIAIYLDHSANCLISENNVISSQYGIVLEGSSNCLLLSNTACNNDYGIVLGGILSNIRPWPSTNCVLRNNTIASSHRYNLVIGGFFGVFFHVDLDGLIHNIDSSNKVNGKPIYYLVNQRDNVVPPDAGYVAVINSTNITVQNIIVTENFDGVLFAYTTNSTIQNVTATGNFRGIFLHNSLAINVLGNNLTRNGIGIELLKSSNCSIIRNIMKRNWYVEGISEPLFGSMLAISSFDNVIYHNNFVDNGQVESDSLNFWDNGYPSGGNYWSDYMGVDWYSGPYQNETGSDGIGDSPYIINDDNIDNYPLMKPYPWNPHDVGITKVGPKTIVGQGFDLPINVTTFNYGMFAETLNISIYINATLFQTKTVTILSRDSTTITFTWNTTGAAKGRYIIIVAVSPVPEETDTTDNTLTHPLTIAMIGDITGLDDYPDGKVDINDLAMVARHFGTIHPHSKYDPNCDIIYDGKIDIKDIFTVAKNFGKTDL